MALHDDSPRGQVRLSRTRAVEEPGHLLADVMAGPVDRGGIDGAVNGLAALVRFGGAELRKVQTGYVRNYALGLAGGTALLVAYAIYRVRF